MVGVDEGREFRFLGDLYSQESTFPLVVTLPLVWVQSIAISVSVSMLVTSARKRISRIAYQSA